MSEPRRTVFNDPRKRNIALIVIGAILGLCILCLVVALIYNNTPQGKASATTAAIAAITKTAQPTNTTAPTKTTAPTNTPVPTNTTGPTDTPAPTDTPTIEPSPTSPPPPIEFKGSGNQIIDFDNPFGAAFAHATYQGYENFIVQNIDENNEMIDLLVNTIGNYDGYRPIDWNEDEDTKRLSVETNGTWTITVYPLARDYMHICAVNTECPGTGDDIFLIHGGTPDIMEYKFDGDSNNIVTGVSSNDGDLLINEIGATSGTVLLDTSTILLIIESEGPWTLTIKGK